MLHAKWWAKCFPPESHPDALLHSQRSTIPLARARIVQLDVPEEPPSPLEQNLWRLRPSRNKTHFRAIFNIGIILVGVLLILFSVTIINRLIQACASGPKFDRFHNLFADSGSNQTIADHLKQLTREPHVAGTPEDFSTADYVISTFKSYGLSTHFVDYNVRLSYPVYRSLELIIPNKNVSKQFSLKEDPVEGDPYSHDSRVIPSFHAYSPSQNASGKVVYVNYGRPQDFEFLKRLGINLAGTIVLAKYGKIYRGDIVSNAANAGAVAALTYSDPADYSLNGTEGYYPDSKWLNPSGIQRGSILKGFGDPLTPGWPSTLDAERLASYNQPVIPSLPISSRDAKDILQSLQGPKAPVDWQGGLNLEGHYKIGPGPGILNFSYIGNQTDVMIRNVFAVIRGSEEPDRYVLLGNHRDAWTFGAVDPNSGTASLLEIARRLGLMLEAGWRPRRSIRLCSWDAEEYGMIGSTEWVEHNVDLLAAQAIAYLNVDCAVAGPDFNAAATPQMDELLKEVSRQINDPDGLHNNLHDSWQNSSGNSALIGRLGGGGSDFASFLQHVGVPAVDLYFGKDYPVYHSLYDNLNWMEKFGDPLFQRHLSVSTLWGLLALRLADDSILPFNYVSYATELQMYAKTLEEQIWKANARHNLTVEPIDLAIAKFLQAAKNIQQESKVVEALEPGSKQIPEAVSTKRSINDRLLLAERAFIDGDGLSESSWHKHLVYGPMRHNGYESNTFPGILDAIADVNSMESNGTWESVQHEIWRVSRVIARAGQVLHGQLT